MPGLAARLVDAVQTAGVSEITTENVRVIQFAAPALDQPYLTSHGPTWHSCRSTSRLPYLKIRSMRL